MFPHEKKEENLSTKIRPGPLFRYSVVGIHHACHLYTHSAVRIHSVRCIMHLSCISPLHAEWHTCTVHSGLGAALEAGWRASGVEVGRKQKMPGTCGCIDA